MNSRGQGRRPGSSLRQGLLIWAFWVLASAASGVILAPVSEPLEVLGGLLLPGAVLGAGQALVLRRYLPYSPTEAISVAGMWVVASSIGWVAGWLVFILIRISARLTGVPEIARQVGSLFAQLTGTETARTQVLEIVIWVTFAFFQGAALALASFALGHRRTLLPLAVLWVPAGTIGGALALAGSSTVVAAAFPVGGFDLFFDRILPGIVGRTTAGALYGAATGVVLAMIARRSAS